jgi:hypothetical protein
MITGGGEEQVEYSVEKLLSISEPWLQYAIKVNLLDGKKEDLSSLHDGALKDNKIQAYLKDISNFNSMLVSKGWDFGQKKAVSPYLSFLCKRLLARLAGQ